MKPTIAASSYLNTAPLIWSFIHGSQRGSVELFTDTAPARCAEMLAQGEVDGALVPVIEYQRLGKVLVVPDVCVGSKTAVRSVVLVTRKNNLKKVERVALDESSRTSAALVRIIFKEFLGFEPEWTTAAPDLHSMMQQADAALIIGDPAMKISRERFRVFDLATLWHEFTGLGFVFAMWMVRPASRDRMSGIDLTAARAEGLANLDRVIADYPNSAALAADEFAQYLTENIIFDIDEDMRRGLDLYFDLAAKYRLTAARRPLEFFGR